MITLTRGSTHATIDASRGFACASLRIGDWELLGPAGMRVSFPWVGDRPARSARLRLGGAALDIQGGPPAGLADGEWTVESVIEQADGATAQAWLRTDPSAAAYPFELRLDSTWRLDDEGLRLELTLTNVSRGHAAFGVGVRVDLAPVGTNAQVLVPAEERWPDDQPGAPLVTAPVAVGASSGPDSWRPVPIHERFEGRFTRRHFANQRTQVAVLAPTVGREVWLSTSSDFREADVAVDADGAGTIESATCTPDAFARHAAGVATGLRVLAPGETWRGSALLVALQRPATAVGHLAAR
jgi:galactose mutarotase-like enzyme